MSENTQHSLDVPHGLNTPHKLPSEDITQLDIINALSLQLYPTGRAWYGPEGGAFTKVHDALNISFVRAVNTSRLLIDETLPDNDNFTEVQAELWEYRLGLIVNNNIDLETRKQAIIRKLGYPNNIKARQHPFFIESQLQLAGLDVFVHENTYPYRTPGDIIGASVTTLQHGGDTQHGDSVQHGGNNFVIIANSTEEVEVYIPGGDNLWATFFIGGENLGDVAIVPKSRLKQFKELVMKLKPAHLAAYTFINYV